MSLSLIFEDSHMEPVKKEESEQYIPFKRERSEKRDTTDEKLRLNDYRPRKGLHNGHSGHKKGICNIYSITEANYVVFKKVA